MCIDFIVCEWGLCMKQHKFVQLHCELYGTCSKRNKMLLQLINYNIHILWLEVWMLIYGMKWRECKPLDSLEGFKY